VPAADEHDRGVGQPLRPGAGPGQRPSQDGVLAFVGKGPYAGNRSGLPFYKAVATCQQLNRSADTPTNGAVGQPAVAAGPAPAGRVTVSLVPGLRASRPDRAGAASHGDAPNRRRRTRRGPHGPAQTGVQGCTGDRHKRCDPAAAAGGVSPAVRNLWCSPWCRAGHRLARHILSRQRIIWAVEAHVTLAATSPRPPASGQGQTARRWHRRGGNGRRDHRGHVRRQGHAVVEMRIEAAPDLRQRAPGDAAEEAASTRSS